MFDLLMMSRNAEYGQNRLQGISKLIRKPSTGAIKDSTTIGEAELWSIFFDPLLSVLVAHLEKVVKFRLSNTSSSEFCNVLALLTNNKTAFNALVMFL